MRYLILFLIVVVIVGLFVVPLRRIEEHEYGTLTEPWDGGELRLSFAPAFNMIADEKWPTGWKKGSPYRVSVIWVSPVAGEAELKVNKLQIDGTKPLVLPPQEKVGADRNNDGKFYSIIAYNDVGLTADLLSIELDCSLKTASGTTRKSFVFKSKRSDRTRWVNAILESVMGI